MTCENNCKRLVVLRHDSGLLQILADTNVSLLIVDYRQSTIDHSYANDVVGDPYNEQSRQTLTAAEARPAVVDAFYHCQGC